MRGCCGAVILPRKVEKSFSETSEPILNEKVRLYLAEKGERSKPSRGS